MHLLFPLAAVALFWAWWSGRLKGLTLDDCIGGALGLLGLRLVTTGQVLTGAGVVFAGACYVAWRRTQARPRPMPVDDARRLLGLGPEASLEEIRAAHRRLIARVHPDVGGSAELAVRINAARDALIAEKTRAASVRHDPQA